MKYKFIMISIFWISGLAIFACQQREGVAGNQKAIVIYQNKVEIHDALTDFAAAYTEETGVEVTVKTSGGDTPYSASLKAEFQSDHQPDIFVVEGQGDYQTWKENLVPFRRQEWMKHTTLAFQTDGDTWGFPVAIEGWGMAYNKELLDKAGIDPATLQSQEAYAAAFAELEALKDELGIDSVVAMAAGPNMTWVTGLHNFNGYLSAGLPYGDRRFIDALNNGEVDEQRLSEYANWVELLFNFADKRVLLTGNYDAQVSQFATQKSVFIHQGNWIDPWLVQNNVNFEMGFAPHAAVAGQQNAIFIGVPSFYVVNQNSKSQKEVNDFLNYLATDRKGHEYMVNMAQMVPAFVNVTMLPSTPLSAAVAEWNRLPNGAYTWLQNDMPDGFGMGTLGPIYGAYAKGDIDKQTFIEQVTTRIQELK